MELFKVYQCLKNAVTEMKYRNERQKLNKASKANSFQNLCVGILLEYTRAVMKTQIFPYAYTLRCNQDRSSFHRLGSFQYFLPPWGPKGCHQEFRSGFMNNTKVLTFALGDASRVQILSIATRWTTFAFHLPFLILIGSSPAAFTSKMLQGVIGTQRAIDCNVMLENLSLPQSEKSYIYLFPLEFPFSQTTFL